MPVLGPDIAAEFLITRTGDTDRQSAAELAAELGGLPLALEQAAADTQATGDSLAAYLAWFRQRRPAMLGRGEPAGYGKTVATTWQLALTGWSSPLPKRLACSGCWRFARRRRSRSACCCSLDRDWSGNSRPQWRRC